MATYGPTIAGAKLKGPRGVAVDPTGTWIYIGDSLGKRIVRIHPDGTGGEVVTTGKDVPEGALGGPENLEFGPDGHLFVSDNNQRVYEFAITG